MGQVVRPFCLQGFCVSIRSLTLSLPVWLSLYPLRIEELTIAIAGSFIGCSHGPLKCAIHEGYTFFHKNAQLLNLRLVSLKVILIDLLLNQRNLNERFS